MKEKKYENPSAELLVFDNDIVLSQESGSCRCYADMGIENDYSAVDSNCWSESAAADELGMHDGAF